MRSENDAVPIDPLHDLEPGVIEALCRTYADVLGRQRTAASPLSSWTHATNRSHEFLWLGGVLDRERLMLGTAKSFRVSRGDHHFDAIQKMHSTVKLNPYERELLYGFPCVVGRDRDKTVRGPLLTVAVEIDAVGDGFEVSVTDDVVRFNTLPFRTSGDSEAHELALARVIEETPPFPLTTASLRHFVEVSTRELAKLEVDAELDGRLASPPSEPKVGDRLRVIDQAVLLVAPRTNYFLRSDLDEIASGDKESYGALPALLAGAGDEEQVDVTHADIDAARIFFPFPSNRAQRKVALLLDDDTLSVVRVEGPPGTGKSLTIANLACHLAASGQRVLVTLQKDKALEVVDAKLRELNLAELPMTLLRRDRDSKAELLSRLEKVDKRRGREEVEANFAEIDAFLEAAVSDQRLDSAAYGPALRCEAEIESAYSELAAAKRLRRVGKKVRARSVLTRAHRRSPEATDELAERITARRSAILDSAQQLLSVGLERLVAAAKRNERQVVRELQSVLKKDQKSFKNFSVFDRLKAQPERARKLLNVLPVWILSPDDVARLFPCQAELFDVVIIDEASQVDLPSIAPIAFRAKKIVVVGDSKQMQSQRFAFMTGTVALEAWQRYGMDKLDPDGRWHPTNQSLLDLASIYAEGHVLLDEHFRSVPPIIEYSNQRWYGGDLRIMTDLRQKRFGPPEQPVIELHEVVGGVISNGSQENEVEARSLVEFLARMVGDPDYADASIGVLCLFQEQVALVNDLVADLIDPSAWEEHSLVIVNPDGFQGDERDVILYSMSWDNSVMPQAALSARQMDTPQIQGMLNVAFTRARDEMHIFHSAPVSTFGMAGGRGGALGEWMTYCAAVHADGTHRPPPRDRRVDSEFEHDVAEALRAHDVVVLHQYPACGFSIDLVCEFAGVRIAVECDGEIYHEDEHGNLRIEDVERQAILERAKWRVLRIPYRKWLREPEMQILRVLEALGIVVNSAGDAEATNAESEIPVGPDSIEVSAEQRVIVDGIRSGISGEEQLLRFARDGLGHKRLGPRIKEGLLGSAQELVRRGLLVIEDGEYFLTPLGRSTPLFERAAVPETPPRVVRRMRRVPSRSGSGYTNRRY